jgi:hypothetical protein
MEALIALSALVGFFLGMAALLAQMRLFKISDTLEELLLEIRKNYFLKELQTEDAVARQQAVLALCSLLLNQRFTCRSMIVVALGECGLEAKTAVPALKQLLNDKDDLLWRQALDAIKLIDPAEFAKLTDSQAVPKKRGFLKSLFD